MEINARKMNYQGLIKLNIISIVLLVLVKGHPQEPDTSSVVRPGRYIPELHGADRGKYMPDLSGKYHHMQVAYDGGYGDRGLKYEKDLRGILQRQNNGGFGLDSRDHLRFMIDFNYNGSGWQVIHFEWVRDGDDQRQYKYVNENKLWSSADEQAAGMSEDPTDSGYSYDPEPVDEGEQGEEVEASEESEPVVESENRDVHLDGEYDENSFRVGYTNVKSETAPDPRELQNTINEVLEYIQQHIVPTLAKD